MSPVYSAIPRHGLLTRQLHWTVIGILAAANVALLLAVQVAPGIGLEHGLMENLQAGGLLLAVVLFAVHQRRGMLSHARPLGWSLVLFCLTFFLLEFDTRPFGIEPLTYLTNGTVRDAWLAALWLVAAVAVLRRWGVQWRAFKAWLPSAAGWYMMAAGVFWVLSHVVEAGPLANSLGPHFLEELMEVNAVALMVGSAMLTGPAARGEGGLPRRERG